MADNINFNDFADRFNAYIQNAKNTQPSDETSEIRIDQKTFAKEICKDTSVFQNLILIKTDILVKMSFTHLLTLIKTGMELLQKMKYTPPQCGMRSFRQSAT